MKPPTGLAVFDGMGLMLSVSREELGNPLNPLSGGSSRRTVLGRVYTEFSIYPLVNGKTMENSL
jgi:hypothetical protein